MKAKVQKSGDITIVDISGKISYENVDPFREKCLQNLGKDKLIFNLQNLNFVGSTGITQFVQTLGDLAQKNPEGLKLCRVSSEFEKIITSGEFSGIEIYDDAHQAYHSFFIKPQT